MNLSSVFIAVAHKVLVAVDLPRGSNQHELNGIEALKQFFGTSETVRGKISWNYFADDQEPTHEDANFTFYDSRAKSADRTGRSEWRFYYYGDFLDRASVGDWLILARSHFGKLFGLVFQNASAWRRAAQALFAIEASQPSFDYIQKKDLDEKTVELVQRRILDELGLEIVIPVRATDEQLMLEKYGRIFPSTNEMSMFARSQIDADITHPDDALISWLDREEELFRALESIVISERLQVGFQTVDEFIEYSLSVQNRRKARMGFALQNHLTQLFRDYDLSFNAQARTEGNSRPDFIFPGIAEYHTETFDTQLLVMLGVKSTAKDRWRQVLDEADRIPRKHLCTLEAGISSKQTAAMQGRLLTLVVPAQLQSTYSVDQRRDLMNIEQFIEFVRKKQLSIPMTERCSCT